MMERPWTEFEMEDVKRWRGERRSIAWIAAELPHHTQDQIGTALWATIGREPREALAYLKDILAEQEHRALRDYVLTHRK